MNTQILGRLLIPSLVILYCGYMIWEQTTGNYRPETRNYAYFMGGIAILLSLIVVARSFLNPSVDADEEDQPSTPSETAANYRLIAMLLVAAIAVVLTIQTLGYLISFTLFLLAALWILGVRKPVPLLSITVGTMLVVHFGLVKALSLPLPAGLLRGMI